MRHSEATNEVIGVLMLLLTGICALAFPFVLSSLLGRFRTIALAAVIALIFGLGVGYAGAWFDAYDQSRGDYHFNHFYDVFSLLALPASLLAEAQSGHGDWGAAESWVYRHSIAANSAVLWLVFSLLLGFIFRALRGRHRSHAQQHPIRTNVA